MFWGEMQGTGNENLFFGGGGGGGEEGFSGEDSKGGTCLHYRSLLTASGKKIKFD
jgi:hypothetical protein